VEEFEFFSKKTKLLGTPATIFQFASITKITKLCSQLIAEQRNQSIRLVSAESTSRRQSPATDKSAEIQPSFPITVIDYFVSL
jgi:hypothetical protein